MKGVQLTRESLPILRNCDVVVAGGSFAGVSAALAFARTGHRVTLVEPRTYLGREITATLRPWVNTDGVHQAPELIAACVRATGRDAGPGEIPLRPDAVKLCLEDKLLAADVQLLYTSLPVGLLVEAGAISGLVIGNKSGRQVLACQAVVDATETAAVARVAGAFFEPETPTSRFSRTIEFDSVSPFRDANLSVPKDLGFVDNIVTLHRGYRGEQHVLVECQMDLPFDIAQGGPFGVAQGGPFEAMGLVRSMQREIKARHRTMRLASHLISHVPAFHHAFLGAASYELCGAHTSRMMPPPPDWAADLDDPRVSVAGSEQRIVDAPLSAFAGPARHLWCLNEAARLEPSHAANLRDPVLAVLVGTALAENVAARWASAPPNRLRAEPIQPSQAKGTAPRLEVRELESPQRGRRYEQRPVPPAEVPILCSADVLVVGGGTSGATAAITSAREGMRTVLLEMNPGLGGTGTLGGVDSYWFGRRVGFAARVAQLVDAAHDSLDYEGRRWNIEAKMHALLREARRTGVEVFWNTVAVGTAVEGNQVRGVVAATRYGLCAVLAQVVVDATGDGDVAAFAGAEAVYGNARDHVVMWYSLAQFVRPGRTQNNFTSMVDVSNVEDTTRAILAGRRRGGDCHDHGIYVAPRETRHVMAGEVLTLTDQLLQRHWPDVVNIHFSNHDIKGHSGSNWIRQGLVPPHLEVEIPYRILLPQGLEQILVAGKAVSATHDALPAIRMQADLENLGGVVGLAAAQAVREGVAPRHIDVAALQRRLVSEGLLPEDVLTRVPEPRHYTEVELEALTGSLDADRPLHATSDMEMDEAFHGPIPFAKVCTLGPCIVPHLERALASAEGARRVRIAQALAMLGSQAGVPTLIDEIKGLLAGEALPARDSRIRHAGLPPDQGAMPSVVYLIYALGMTRDGRSLTVWEQVAELLDPTEESMRDRLKGTFYYVDAVCFGAERLGDPAAIPILERMHAHATLRDQAARDGFQPDHIPERQAMLELAIGRALARCGSRHGVTILITYLDDNRALLAEQAHTELVAISGQDQGKDAQAWNEWLAGDRESLKPCPLPQEG